MYIIIDKITRKPHTKASGIYETPQEPVEFLYYHQAIAYLVDKPNLTYELKFPKVEKVNIPDVYFVSRLAHKIQVGDIVLSLDGKDRYLEVESVEERENNIILVKYVNGSCNLFGINEPVLIFQEFETHYTLEYSKSVPLPDGKTTGGFNSVKISPTKEIHDNRLESLREGIEEGWITNVKESSFLVKDLGELNVKD